MEDKKRLIDINPIISNLTAMKSMYDSISLDGMIKGLENAPTVDAAPVVHGRWIEKEYMVASYLEDCTDVFYECAVCKGPNVGESTYCPNCGAKMDLEG